MDGTTLPPSIIYQAESGNLQDTWLDDFKPKEHTCHFASSSSGWTNEDLRMSWLTGIFDRYTKQKARNGRDYRLLFVDGHSSHLNMKFLTWCEQHWVHVAIYPPHSTHRLQPLDVSLFNPLANYYSQNLTQWITKTQGLCSISKRDFFRLFWPFNPSEVLNQVKWIATAVRPPTGHSSGSSALSEADCVERWSSWDIISLCHKACSSHLQSGIFGLLDIAAEMTAEWECWMLRSLRHHIALPQGLQQPSPIYSLSA